MSIPFIERDNRSLSRMSPSMMVIGPFSIAQARFSLRPRSKLSKITISETFSSTRRSAICEPTSPAPPVINVLLFLSFIIFALIISCAPFYKLRRNPSNHRKGRYIFRHYGSSSHLTSFADRYTWQYHSIYANVRPRSNRHPLYFKICLNDWNIQWQTHMD